MKINNVFSVNNSTKKVVQKTSELNSLKFKNLYNESNILNDAHFKNFKNSIPIRLKYYGALHLAIRFYHISTNIAGAMHLSLR